MPLPQAVRRAAGRVPILRLFRECRPSPEPQAILGQAAVSP